MRASVKILIVLLMSVSSKIWAQVDPVGPDHVAIGGYDLVSYFTDGRAVKGSAAYSSWQNDIRYYFSSAENRKKFEENPVPYLPQYDGYCALAVSYGKKISVDPMTFKITNGKLYLFYNGKAAAKKVNSLETWNKNEPRLLEKADHLWPEVQKSKYKSGGTL